MRRSGFARSAGRRAGTDRKQKGRLGSHSLSGRTDLGIGYFAGKRVERRRSWLQCEG